MDTPPDSDKTDSSGDKPSEPLHVGAYVAAIILFIGLVGVCASAGPASIWPHLAFGWLAFMDRNLPEASWNWDLIGMAVVCLTGMAVGIQWLGNRLAVAVQRRRDQGGAAWQWPWKWTACMLGMLGVCFLVGTAASGVARQTGWLLGSTESWYEPKNNAVIADFRMLDGAFQQAWLETTNNVTEARKLFWTYVRWPDYMSSHYCFMVLTNEEGKMTGTLMFPRDSKLRQQWGYEAWGVEDGIHTNLPNDKIIEEIITRHGDRLVSF